MSRPNHHPWRRLGRPLVLAGVTLAVSAGAAHAQADLLSGLIPSGDATVSGRIIQLIVILTALSVAPGLLIMVTSFTRFVIALSFLRSGLGLQSTPANLVLISLALFMTFYVMAPTFDRAWTEGMQPLMDGKITEEQAFGKVTEPFREFMIGQVKPKDLQMFADLAAETQGGVRYAAIEPDILNDGEESIDNVDFRILIPAFMVSELRRAFEIGFLIVLPFLVIDLIVGTLVMSMGMMMMPPVVLALPFKILFFILIDGWTLVVGGLVRSVM